MQQRLTLINLLPWRDRQREWRKKQFFVIMGIASSVTVILFVLSHVIVSNRIDYQSQRNALLQQEIDAFNSKIQEIQRLKKLKAALIVRMEIIHRLQLSRPQIVHLFDELVKILPDGIHLSKVERRGDKVDFVGVAESNTNVSNMMRKVDTSKWLYNPLLSEIKKKDKKQSSHYEFNMQASMSNSSGLISGNPVKNSQSQQKKETR